MSVSSTRKTTIVYSGDVDGTQEIAAADNANSPGTIGPITITTGSATIIVPTGGAVPTAVTIVPPGGNEASITLKGVVGDTGIRLHNTDPTTIALHSSITQFVLTVGADVVGLRLFWS